MGECVIQHMLELNGSFFCHVHAHALWKARGIECLHGQTKQQFGVINLLLALSRCQSLLPRCPRPTKSLRAMPHLSHHGVEVEESGLGAVTHHLIQHHIRPSLGRELQLSIEGLLLDRNACCCGVQPGGCGRHGRSGLQWREDLQGDHNRSHHSRKHAAPTQPTKETHRRRSHQNEPAICQNPIQAAAHRVPPPMVATAACRPHRWRYGSETLRQRRT